MLQTTLAAGLALAVPPAAGAQASAAIAYGQAEPSALSPGEIVAAAPAKDWAAVAPSDLLVMTLAPDRDGMARQVVIQLMPPPFSQGWVGNIRKLAATHWWDGLSINRVQDNYVVQWGDANAEDKAKAKALPAGLSLNEEASYTAKPSGAWAAAVNVQKFDGTVDGEKPRVGPCHWDQSRSAYDCSAADVIDWMHLDFIEPAAYADHFESGWPVASDYQRIWPVHCYGMVGVGRDLAPDTGSGAELYTVIGHAPRHLDRNIALVGRVVEGIEHLSSLPRGTGALGFYEKPEQRVPIASIQLASELPKAQQPRFEYLSTESESFARYADARANRRDPFFNVPAGGADICNIPVPIRRAAK